MEIQPQVIKKQKEKHHELKRQMKTICKTWQKACFTLLKEPFKLWGKLDKSQLKKKSDKGGQAGGQLVEAAHLAVRAASYRDLRTEEQAAKGHSAQPHGTHHLTSCPPAPPKTTSILQQTPDIIALHMETAWQN